MIKLKNQFEKKIYKQLRKAHVDVAYESVRIPYILSRNYIPDFVIHTPTGLVYIETKGYLRREDKSKLTAVKKQHPEKDIRIVFYSLNKNNIKWAEKTGFRYAVGTVPKEWLSGL